MERTAGGIALETTGALLLTTAVCDALGFHSISFLLLVLCVAVAAGAGLAAFARVIDENAGRVQASLAAALLAVVLCGAVVRSPAVAASGVPLAATVALAAAFVVLLLQALVALVERPSRSTI
jgi:hypothetical protein